MQTILSDLDRRLVGNLSIPRNLEDLTAELRKDKYLVGTDGEPLHVTEKLVADTLAEHIDLGFVVNLGDGRSKTPGELASVVDKHKQAVSMPDEKARIFEKRLSDDSRAWRLKGDVFHFTSSGFEKLHEPVTGSPLFAFDVLQRMVSAHVRAIKDVPFEGNITDAEGGRLIDPPKGFSLAKGTTIDGERVATLLPQEFEAWYKQICDFSRQVYGKIPERLQSIGGGQPGWGDADEILIIAAENGGTAYQITAPWYCALTTVGVTDADTGSTITEPTGATGYARKSVALGDMAAGVNPSTNSNAIVFAAITGGTSQAVIGFSKTTASSAGRNVKYGTCASTTISTTQTPPQFAIGQLSTSAD